MRAFSLAEIVTLEEGEVLLRGQFDLQSGPRGWRATVTIEQGAHPGTVGWTPQLRRRYRLVLASGESKLVECVEPDRL